MIQFALYKDKKELKTIWKSVFNDTDFFIDLYFKHNFNPANTLIFRDKGQIVSMLFMRPYEFRFWNETILCYYLSGLATLPEFRNQHIMCQLINASVTIMKERNIPLAVLIPANEKIYDFYKKFDFVQVFEKDNEQIPIERIIDNNSSLRESFVEFDSIFREKDFCIQKDFTDFQAIIAEWEYARRPKKNNIAGMAKLIAPHALFNIYKWKTGSEMTLNIDNNAEVSLKNNILTVCNTVLCRLLFGFHTATMPKEIAAAFPEHKPILNLMLE